MVSTPSPSRASETERTDKYISFRCGDIILTDSNRFGAKCVKFLMTAPTIWQYIWRAMRGTQQEVRFYHVGMCLSSTSAIEQQSRVQIVPIDDILDKDKYIVYRNKFLSSEERDLLHQYATADDGEKYDILLILGKTLTWLTGIRWFTRIFQQPEKEFCVTRVAYWYSLIDIGFGRLCWHEVTTDDMDNYCRIHKWMVVDEKGISN